MAETKITVSTVASKITMTDAKLKAEVVKAFDDSTKRIEQEKATKSAAVPDELRAEILKSLAVIGPRNMGYAIGITNLGVTLAQAEALIAEYEAAI